MCAVSMNGFYPTLTHQSHCVMIAKHYKKTIRLEFIHTTKLYHLLAKSSGFHCCVRLFPTFAQVSSSEATGYAIQRMSSISRTQSLSSLGKISIHSFSIATKQDTSLTSFFSHTTSRYICQSREPRIQSSILRIAKFKCGIYRW